MGPQSRAHSAQRRGRHSRAWREAWRDGITGGMVHRSTPVAVLSHVQRCGMVMDGARRSAGELRGPALSLSLQAGLTVSRRAGRLELQREGEGGRSPGGARGGPGGLPRPTTIFTMFASVFSHSGTCAHLVMKCSPFPLTHSCSFPSPSLGRCLAKLAGLPLRLRVATHNGTEQQLRSPLHAVVLLLCLTILVSVRSVLFVFGGRRSVGHVQ
ncbi:hypothetical protein KC19_2G196800 [Ceratodon purpureus]|nr:hypothetical protein KC19_2G196800 [Ceratodon purpureus]